MKQYLTKIDERKSVNLDAFTKKVVSYGIMASQLKEIFAISKDTTKKGNFYFLSIKNMDLYITMFGRFSVNDKNKKVELSLHGDSKKAKSDFSFLLIKTDIGDQIPSVITFNKEAHQHNLTEPLKSKLIIIENEDSFGNALDSFKDEDLHLAQYNTILGSGNTITNSYFKGFLERYDEVICYFDIDLGGLKMFSSLVSLLDTKVEFFFSEKMERYLSDFGNAIDDNQFRQLSRYYHTPGLEKVIKAIQKHKKFAEQEIFQH